MTKASALQLLADLVGDDPDYLPALEALRPRPRAVKASRAELACKEILRNLRRPEGFGGRVYHGRYDDRDRELARYLDTFGPAGSPEREAQAARLERLEAGPSPEAFGRPGRVCWVARAANDWQDDDRRHAAERAAQDAWRYTDGWQEFEDAKALHEARKAQFAYVPKGKKDDERATFALAVLARTSLEDSPAAVAA